MQTSFFRIKKENTVNNLYTKIFNRSDIIEKF